LLFPFPVQVDNEVAEEFRTSWKPSGKFRTSMPTQL
jgi:hypothetical protein